MHPDVERRQSVGVWRPKLELPYFDSDDYFHGPSDPPFQNPRSATERFEMITSDLKPDQSWILSGGIAGWEPYPPLNISAFLFLQVPTEIRVSRLRQREYERFGERIRAGGDMHEAHEAFIQWASRYDVGDVEGKTLKRHEAYLMRQTVPVVRDSGEQPVGKIVEALIDSLQHRSESL